MHPNLGQYVVRLPHSLPFLAQPVSSPQTPAAYTHPAHTWRSHCGHELESPSNLSGFLHSTVGQRLWEAGREQRA